MTKDEEKQVGVDKTPKTTASASSSLVSLSAIALLLSLAAAWYFNSARIAVVKTFDMVRGVGELSRLDNHGFDSDLMKIDVRHLVSDLVCNDSDYSAAPLFDGKTFHVTEPMETQQPMADDRAFFMLNGANDGVYVSWNGQFECVGQAAEVAAAWLGADRDVMVNGVRLYSQMGFPVRNEAELKATKNIVHVLLDFQLWQWPGIKKGYKYVLEDGVTLTTVGMIPKVFDVEHYFTQEEANKIIEIGSPSLGRSRVVNDESDGSETVVSEARTSHTAFLPDSQFTRDFRVRGARLARLPSPSFVERLQLVRYNAGEFYRRHLDTFNSLEFLPKESEYQLGMKSYKQWANWAADKIRELTARREIPKEFQEGGTLFPDAEDSTWFPNELLKLFSPVATESNDFASRYEDSWLDWIAENVANNASDIMPNFIGMDAKPHYLPLIIKAWENALGIPELHYNFPKNPVNDVAHYFAWIRWAKDRINFMSSNAPAIVRPGNLFYPTFGMAFQANLLDIILDDFSKDFITRFLPNEDWYNWMTQNRGKDNVLVKVLQVSPQFAELTVKAWEAHVEAPPQLRYKLPKFVKNFFPQRYVTLFLYLNNETKIGGETVFPISRDRYSEEAIVRTGMDECSYGLAVPPLALHASLFYVQTATGDVDLMSRHGGCPPHEGTKWGSNSFMWDSNSEEINDQRVN
ncbi:Transmembrane prolyl 4-hydroxylase [Phytophthora ramorum]|uniref:Transmembrane prolyl 4-hydroxylase n=1 Tax=Phytophthora ramorum TaxID=164328 RepID=UPI00309BAA3F|nr:Transmembrane prolyl 4-hydroxylase [Phytophthora ramorum]